MSRAAPRRSLRLPSRVPLAIAIILLGSSLSFPAEARPAAPDRIVDLLEKIESGMVETRYQHRTRVRHREGKYFFDCSGMASWILRRTAPAALRAVGKPNDRRPLAVHFFSRINRIDPGERRGPWMRVATAAHARPGDLIAWKRPKWFPSKSTGHVAFVVGHPEVNRGPVPGILVRVADSSKFKHEDDSRDPGTTGFGTGVLLLPTDDAARPIGYGWIGSRTRPEWVVPAEIVIGRPLR